MERRWISVKECAEYLGLHEKTVYSLFYQGKIPAARIGGSVRVDKRMLDKNLEISRESLFPIKTKDLI